MKTNLSKPTPVRLYIETHPRLKLVAKKFRLSPAAIIRLAVDDKLAEWMNAETIKIEANPHA